MSSRPYIVHRVSTTQPTGQQVGDEWFDPATNTLTKNLAINGSAVAACQVLADVTGNISISGNIISTGNINSGNLRVTGTVNDTTVGVGGGNINTNTALGINALTSNTTGFNNTAVGSGALRSHISGGNNTAVGFNSMQATTIGSTNTAVGVGAMLNNVSGSTNSAFGAGALRNGTTSTSNTAIGSEALLNCTGTLNTALGRNSGLDITTGNNNVIIGSYTGNSGGLDIRTTSNNIVLSDGGGSIRLYINSSGNMGIGTVGLEGRVISMVNFGNGVNVNYVGTPVGNAQGQLSGYSFRSTFQGSADNGPRRSADIWSGFNGGVWGTEFLAFGVGNNGVANDAANVTIERMRIDGGGRVTTPNQPCAVATKNNGSGWVGFTGTWIFNNVLLNVGNHYNSTTGVFTCPVAGVYQVYAMMLGGQGGGNGTVSVRRNGVDYNTPGGHYNTNGVSLWFSVPQLVYINCAANDQLTIYVTASAGSVFDTSSYSQMAIRLVG